MPLLQQRRSGHSQVIPLQRVKPSDTQQHAFPVQPQAPLRLRSVHGVEGLHVDAAGQDRDLVAGGAVVPRQQFALVPVGHDDGVGLRHDAPLRRAALGRFLAFGVGQQLDLREGVEGGDMSGAPRRGKLQARETRKPVVAVHHLVACALSLGVGARPALEFRQVGRQRPFGERGASIDVNKPDALRDLLGLRVLEVVSAGEYVHLHALTSQRLCQVAHIDAHPSGFALSKACQGARVVAEHGDAHG